MEGRNLPRIEAPLNMERDDDDLVEFVEAAVTLMESHLEANHKEAQLITDVEKSVEDVFANHNTRSVEVRALPLENPRVTLWLKDCPVWANDAWTETFHPKGLNAYNGKVQATFDVRPF